MIWIIFISMLVVSTIIVNKSQQIYMRIIGASAMFFDGKKKLIAIIVVALFLSGIILNLFGIEIPKNY